MGVLLNNPITLGKPKSDEGYTARVGNAIATPGKLISDFGNPPATLGKPIATAGEGHVVRGEALVACQSPRNELADFGNFALGDEL